MIDQRLLNYDSQVGHSGWATQASDSAFFRGLRAFLLIHFLSTPVVMKNLIEGPLAFCFLTNLAYQSKEKVLNVLSLAVPILYTCIHSFPLTSDSSNRGTIV